jgi:hypothetical protein
LELGEMLAVARDADEVGCGAERVDRFGGFVELGGRCGAGVSLVVKGIAGDSRRCF